MLLSVIPVFLLSPTTLPTTKDNLPQTVLIVVSVTAVFNLVTMVLLIFDVPARLLAPAEVARFTLRRASAPYATPSRDTTTD